MTPHAREFAYTTADFERVRTLIYRLSGIVLGSSKQDMVYSRLARRLRACGLKQFSVYVDLVECDTYEREAFVNALTTNLTAFFREGHHFTRLTEHVRSLGLPAGLRVWCAAASSGEEPYSIAIALAQAYGAVPPHARIVASDIDTQMLAQARRGVYPLERLGAVNPELRRAYFLRGTGPNAGFARVRPELRATIDFAQINLLDATWPHREGFDAIFCRNVLIYFDKATQRTLLRRFHALLRPGALLMTGHSESLLNVDNLYDVVGHTVYRRREPRAEVA